MSKFVVTKYSCVLQEVDSETRPSHLQKLNVNILMTDRSELMFMRLFFCHKDS